MKKICVLYFAILSIEASAQWSTLNSGTTNFLGSIYFPQKDTGYVTGPPLKKTTNGGVNWSTVTAPINSQVLYFLTGKTGFIGGTDIRKTTDGGSTWANNFPFSTLGILGIHFPNGSTGYAVGINNTADTILIFKTTNTGNNWSQAAKIYDPISPATAICFTDINTGYISTGGGIVYKTSNGGTTWVQVYNNSLAFGLNGMHFPAQDTGYAVGDGGAVIKTTNGGVTWTSQTNTNTNPLYAVSFVSTKRGFACGGDGISSGDIIETNDGGLNWTLSASNVQTFQSIHFPTSNIGYACGTNGIILKYDASLGIWEQQSREVLRVYPNPSSGSFTVLGKGQLEIFDLLGEKIYSDILTIPSSLIHLTSSISKGVYFLKLQNGEKVYTDKIIIQ